MSHLQPLTVTWSSGAVGVGDHLEGLHIEEATTSLSCPPTLLLCSLAPQRSLRGLGKCFLRLTKAGGPQATMFCLKPGWQALLCSLSVLCFSSVRACGLAFPSLAS